MFKGTKVYITTAIPYVNGAPHIGFAQEIVQADTLARFYKLLEKDVYFLTGTDENALKNVQAAESENITTQALVDKYSEKFKELKTSLNINYDDFIRTTEERHIKGAQKFWQACEKDIYKKHYKGLYCVGCEEFKTEKDLENGECPEHPGKQLEIVEEENYFFALSKYQNQLKELIETETLKIVPEFRKNEILAFIDQGLEDFSISRSKERAKGWGIPVPGDDSQIIYVWFDALINYITALGYADDQELYKKYWVENENKIHCIGKGITRFHAIYWPAMLLSAGLPLPTIELVHGYLTINGQKISKSLGNVIDPNEFTQKYNIDATRYYLLKVIPPTKDGDFTEEQFIEIYNGELANGLGNTVARVARLAEKAKIQFENTFPLKSTEIEELLKPMEEFRFDLALQNIWSRLAALDKHINEHEPWKIKDSLKLTKVLQYEVDELRKIATVLEPFLPETAQKIKEQFRGPRIKVSKPLFPRI